MKKTTNRYDGMTLLELYNIQDQVTRHSKFLVALHHFRSYESAKCLIADEECRAVFNQF